MIPMYVLIFCCLLVFLWYLQLMVRYRRAWCGLPETEVAAGAPLPGVSVVIAFRNEEENLPALLDSLDAQDYPVSQREFILADDHSSDRSAALVAEFSQGHEGFRLAGSSPETGKKAALLAGIGLARFPVVVTTDADCTMGVSWLRCLAGPLAGGRPSVAMGPVDQEPGQGFIGKFGALEFVSLNASGAAAAAGGRAVFCSGASLAYPLSLFRLFPDPLRKDVVSGDDTLLLLHAKHQGMPVKVVKNRNAVVTTRVPGGWKPFLASRARWGFKPGMYADAAVLFTALRVALQSLAMLCALAVIPLGGMAWLFPTLVLMKYAADAWFLHPYLKFYGKQLPWLPMFAFEAVYPLYVAMTAGMALAGNTSWKGRRYVRKTPVSSRVRREI
jgi:cellulose synthase/poly-beta-1,6-N-acetylglucosamine synthase-like glycosyltransferase